jgi:hypothetical protein
MVSVMGLIFNRSVQKISGTSGLISLVPVCHLYKRSQQPKDENHPLVIASDIMRRCEAK